MNKKRKVFLRVLYYVSVSLILVCLGAVCLGIIFYASGYQVNWRAKKIQKTGILLINSNENNLTILLDKKPLGIKKTRNITLFNFSYKISLLPGEHDLEIKKPDRISYTQRIKIEPELITKIENILLLPEKVPDEKLAEKSISQYLISPNNKKIIYQSDNKIFIYNLDKKEDLEFSGYKFDDKINLASWDSLSQRALIQINKNEGKNYYVIDTEKIENSFLLTDRFSYFPFFDQLYFSPQNKDDFWGLEKNSISKAAIAQNKIERVDTGISHFAINKNYFYYQNQNNIIRLDPANSNKKIILENFLLKEDFKFKTLSGESDVFFTNEKNLYFIKDKNNLELIDKEVEDFFTEEEDRGLFFIKGFEIWHYNHPGKNTNMVSRFSKEIKNIQEFFNNAYLLYQQGTDISVIKKDSLFNQAINNNVDTVKVFDKNKILIIEKNGELISFKTISLGIE